MRAIIPDDPWFELALIREATVAEVRAWMTAEELQFASSLRLESRQLEWMASRAAAKFALRQRGLIDRPGDVSLHDVTARPPRIAALDLSISLSHSRSHAAGGVSRDRIGIDLEVDREMKRGLLKFFLSAAEQDMARELPPSAMIHLWSAKEASFKAVSTLILLTEMTFESIVADADGYRASFTGAGLTGVVRTTRVGELIVALARVSSSAETPT